MEGNQKLESSRDGSISSKYDVSFEFSDIAFWFLKIIDHYKIIPIRTSLL